MTVADTMSFVIWSAKILMIFVAAVTSTDFNLEKARIVASSVIVKFSRTFVWSSTLNTAAQGRQQPQH